MSKLDDREAKRNQILETSLDLFIRNGYYGTTTKEIAQKIKMSQSLFFHYFESKDIIFTELLQRAEFGMSFAGGVGDLTQSSPIKTIEKITEIILKAFSSLNTAKLFMLVAHAQICTKLPEDIKEIAMKISQSKMMMDLVKRAQEMGEVREGSVEALTGCWYSAIQGVAWTHICYPFIPLPEPQWIIDMIKAV